MFRRCAWAVSPPTPDAVFDYQIGGAYDNPAAKVVSRDRQDEADHDLHDIRTGTAAE